MILTRDRNLGAVLGLERKVGIKETQGVIQEEASKLRGKRRKASEGRVSRSTAEKRNHQ